MSKFTGLTRLGLVVLLAALPLTGAIVLPAPAAQAQVSTAVTKKRPIVNYGKGEETTEATVSVNMTKNLVDRQQVAVDLSGFMASHNTNNTAANGTRIEYPVVVMQCRSDDPARNECLDEERVQWHPGFDVNAPAEQRVVAQTQDAPGDTKPYPPGKDVYDQMASMFRVQQLPFVAANGVSYLWSTQNRPDGSPLIDEPRLKSYKPTDVSSEGAATVNTRNIPVKPDGTNKFLFEVRQNGSQPSLGCTDRQFCSIVVVPIMDMACVESAPEACTSGAVGPGPGSPDGGTDSYNRFLASQQWLAESNWRNRIIVPIRFAPDLESCDVRDNRPTIPAFGSELVSVAQERWGAAYCTGVRPSSYLPVYTQGSEYFGRRQLTSKLGSNYLQDAVFVTQPVTDSPRPMAHAPSAITGFAVAFVVDNGNGAQAQSMTLSARLLAKLLTQSYNPLAIGATLREGKTLYDGTQKITNQAEADRYYVAHPALMNNPRSLFADPEFAALNPDFVLKQGDNAIAPHLLNTINTMIFTVESDVMMDVTRYVTSDQDARRWLDGFPDQYGMRVNPDWEGMQPTQIYSLLDTWQRTPSPRQPSWNEAELGDLGSRWQVLGGGNTCDEMHKTPYLTRLANIANSAKASAQLLLDRRGSATPICSQTLQPIDPEDQAPEPQFPGDDVGQDVRFNENKETADEFGKRAQLALTTVPLARVYALPVAKLVNAGGKAVAPTPGTMVNALRASVLDEESGTLQIDHPQVTGNWYPGTMLSYLAVPTAGLDPATAGRYADYIEFMATTGQTLGQTLANLPVGYDPLPPALVQQALDVAKAVREQKGEQPPAPEDGPLGDGAGSGDLPPVPDPPGNGLVAPQGGGPDDAAVDTENVAKTEGTSSWLARWAIPLMIAFGLLAGLVAFAVQVSSQPDHPLRRKLDELLRAVRLR